MKATRICLALVIIAGVAFSASHTYRQVVRQVPDTTGYVWYSWDINNIAYPSDYLDKNSAGSGCLYSSTGQFMRWFADCANFPSGDDWVDGDLLCIIGSWDSDPGTVNHTGYYWLYSDEMDAAQDPQSWTPDDTMRVMPKPMVSQLADSLPVIVEIENPYETNHPPLAYDVRGYGIVLDSTATGIESFFDVVLGFAPVTGGPGGSTFFEYNPSDYLPVMETYTTYHAYYIVARPETTTTPGVCPGFSTYHMSQNSDPLVVVGVAEYDDAVPASFSARPSVFTDRTNFAVTLPEQALVNIKLYDAAGQLVSTVCDEVLTAGAHTINYDGKALPSGVYFYTLKTDNEQLTGQIVKLH
jgi:hypothetical protein